LLLLITDPFGNIPFFANALRHVAPERRTWVILRENLIAFGLLLAFMFLGEGLLWLMGLILVAVAVEMMVRAFQALGA